MKKDITPHNDKGKPHGYWEWYHANGELYYKGYYKDGNPDGLWEWYYTNGKLNEIEYYIN